MTRKSLLTLGVLMSKKVNIQDVFLNHIRKRRIPVTIYLVNGVKIEGLIKGFDNFVIILKDDSQKMIYKHAVSTIEPSEEIDEIEMA
jgi:host factor-I protein